jgi:hypothetical protein
MKNTVGAEDEQHSGRTMTVVRGRGLATVGVLVVVTVAAELQCSKVVLFSNVWMIGGNWGFRMI